MTVKIPTSNEEVADFLKGIGFNKYLSSVIMRNFDLEFFNELIELYSHGKPTTKEHVEKRLQDCLNYHPCIIAHSQLTDKELVLALIVCNFSLWHRVTGIYSSFDFFKNLGEAIVNREEKYKGYTLIEEKENLEHRTIIL